VPGDATDVRFDGDAIVRAKGPDGATSFIATTVDLLSSQSKTFTLRFQRPEGDGEMFVTPSARAAATAWTYGAESWKDDYPHRVRY